MSAMPAAVARCQGVGDDEEGWREGCDDCARRTASPSGERQVWMAPPQIIVFECEYRIAPPNALAQGRPE